MCVYVEIERGVYVEIERGLRVYVEIEIDVCVCKVGVCACEIGCRSRCLPTVPLAWTTVATSAYVSIRQHASACVGIREDT